MAVEIERKFLVANDLWRGAAVGSETIREGFVAAFIDRKVRVRTSAERATLTVKTARLGMTCSEFEYEIPRADAEEMLTLFCARATLSKTRHRVPHGGFMWEVDVYGGALEGVILAEVEIERADVEPPLPPWVGAEVTGDPRYKKGAMLRARSHAGIQPWSWRSRTIAPIVPAEMRAAETQARWLEIDEFGAC
jgi:adenylate cyclase